LTAFAAKVSTSQSCFSSILCVRRNARPAFSTDNTPAYTLATPVWGGRLDFKLFIPVGGARTQIDALVTGALGPIGLNADRRAYDCFRRRFFLLHTEVIQNFPQYLLPGAFIHGPIALIAYSEMPRRFARLGSHPASSIVEKFRATLWLQQ
jgi:hypothetical protein